MPRYLISGVFSPQVMERVREHGLSVGAKNAEAIAAHFGGKVIGNYLAFEAEGPRCYTVADVPAPRTGLAARHLASCASAESRRGGRACG
jgi:hypothetical protein